MPAEPLPADLDLNAVAYAIGRVLAMKAVLEDPKLSKLDALGRSTAIHSMTQVMAASLTAEAEAAIRAVVAQLRDPGRPVPPHGSGGGYAALNAAYSEQRRLYAMANPGADMKGLRE